jgi:hypothetical protein
MRKFTLIPVKVKEGYRSHNRSKASINGLLQNQRQTIVHHSLHQEKSLTPLSNLHVYRETVFHWINQDLPVKGMKFTTTKGAIKKYT